MSARLAVVLIGAVTALVLGGCRADDRAVSSAVPVGGPAAEPVTDTAAEPVIDAAAGPADPLASVEAVVGAVERDLDADAGVAGR